MSEKTTVPQALHTDEKTTTPAALHTSNAEVPRALHAEGKTIEVPRALHTSNAEDLPVMRISADDKTTCIASSNPPQPLNPLPAGFDADLAYLLGLCCIAAGEQYSTYVTNTPQGKPTDPTSWQIKSVKPGPWDPDFSQIQRYTSTTHDNLTVYEKDVDGNDVQIPAGFITLLAPTDRSKSKMIVVAFHGTQNKYESDKVDNHVTPAPFGGNHGSVHGGFYDHYKKSPKGLTLAQQVHNFIDIIFMNRHEVPPAVKVTGHSMGGALATLCAIDIAEKYQQFVKDKLSMYSLASPRVADALADKKDRGEAGTFVSYYQQTVPDSYRIVNTKDPVPTLPSASSLLNVCAHVLGDTVAINDKIVSENPALDGNLVSFADTNERNKDKPECKGEHSCRAVYLPFLKSLTEAS
jgi:hypothetical protein